MKTRISVLVGLILIIGCNLKGNFPIGADPVKEVVKPTSILTSPLADLYAKTSLQRSRAAENLVRERKEKVNFLLKIVQDTIDKPQQQLNEPKELSINLLGEYNAKEATDILTEHISLQVQKFTSNNGLDGFPVVQALIKIGNPSVKEILRRLKPLTSETPEYSERDLHLFAYVIRQVDGDEVGLFRLQLAAKNAQGTHKVNLLNLIDIYKLNEDETQIRRAIEVIPAG